MEYNGNDENMAKLQKKPNEVTVFIA